MGFQVFCDRPRIVDVGRISESETVVPRLDAGFIGKSVFIHGCEDFFFREAEPGRVFLGSRGDDVRVIEIRKNGFFADAGNAEHQATGETFVIFKRQSHQRLHKFDEIVPKTVEPSA